MALCCRRFSLLSLRQVGSKSFFNARVFSLKAAPEAASATQATGETFDEKNARLKRPLSPHISIYQPQLTWLLSISHRATGLMMGGIFMSFGIGGLLLPKNYPEYLAVVESLHLSPTTVVLLKAFIAFPFCYHYCNGVRHLLWDLGKFLTIKQVYVTGYGMLLAALGLTGVLVFCL